MISEHDGHLTQRPSGTRLLSVGGSIGLRGFLNHAIQGRIHCQLPTPNSQLPTRIPLANPGSWALGVDEESALRLSARSTGCPCPLSGAGVRGRRRRPPPTRDRSATFPPREGEWRCSERRSGCTL